MKLIALVTVFDGKKATPPGDVLTVKNNEEAQSLIARGFARLADDPPPPPPPQGNTPPPPQDLLFIQNNANTPAA